MTASSASLMHQEFTSTAHHHHHQNTQQTQTQPQQSSATKHNVTLSHETNTSKSSNGSAPPTPVVFRTRSNHQDQLPDTANGEVGESTGGAHTTSDPTPIHTINEHHFAAKSNHVERIKSNDSYSQPISPRQMSTDNLNHSLIYKVGPTGGIIIPKKSSVSSSRKSSATSLIDHSGHNGCSPHYVGNETIPEMKAVPPIATGNDNYHDLGSRSRLLKFSTTSTVSSPTTPLTRSTSNNTNYFPNKSYQTSPVIETNHILLEYDPITRRKVLNTYEILREIGRGEHGKVKLARDLIRNELVAIKIVNRKSRKERPALRLRKDSNAPIINEYELKIKREIAIMKKCHHKHVVALKEVLDDVNSLKIYLVLEYMEKGEIKWKKLSSDKKESMDNRCYDIDDNEIPCCGSRINRQPQKHHSFSNETDLLSDEFSPNLTFKQSRKIFRDVLLGLEYLHMQGIVHRDIKPANLLVSADNCVKISDFGVSFASSLAENEEGHLVNELDLAKTAGTPAFFAPELCSFFPDEASAPGERRMSCNGSAKPPKIDYKIDIWALGVTLYCLLFGKVPFNAETEYDLFQVIVNQPLEFPKDIESFKSPGVVSEDEFKLAKDLLCRMLDKNRKSRITIADIKVHPFTLMDLDDNIEGLNELFHHNGTAKEPLNFNLEDHDISQAEIDNAIIGIGTRFKRGLVKAIRAGGLKDHEIRDKFAALHLEHSKSENSEESSSGYSNYNSSTRLSGFNNNNNNSMILSEGLPISGATPPPQALPSKMASLLQSKTSNGTHDKTNLHFPSALAHQIPNSSTSSSSASSMAAYPNQFSFAGNREVTTTTTTTTTTATASAGPAAPAASGVPPAAGKSFLQDMIESHSNSSSRRGSSAGISVSEAPQIETKRNVGGDLYLINQSAVETIKGLKLEDDKRRKSSIFSLHGGQQPTSNKGSSSHESTMSAVSPPQQQHVHHYTNIAAPIPVPAVAKPVNGKNNQIFGDYLLHTQDTESKPSLKIGPIGGVSSDERGIRDDSIMSLPLSESFASLDSINDDYLTMKYQEYTKSRKDNTKSEMKGAATEGVVPVTQQMRRKSSLSDSDIPQLEEHFKFNNPKEGANTITEKFKAFNLGNSMKSGVGGAKFDVATETKKTTYFPNRNNSGTTSDEDPIGPVVINRYSSNESYSSYSSSGSSDEEDEEESDEENLTLAFQSKVAPLSRANFLSLTGRAKSHESNLPTLGSNRNNNNSNNGGGSSNGSHYGFQTPIIFHDGLPEFEDVPDGLIGEDSSDNSTPTGYGYYDNSSIPPVISTNVSTTTLTTDMNKSPSVETKLVVPTALQDNAVKISSPLNPRSAASAATIRQPSYKERKKSLRENICNNQFNNHYKKGPVYSPFPNAKHLDNDEESIVKESENKFLSNRPSFFRSNSVTVGLLSRHGAGSEFDVGAAADDKKEEQSKE